MLATTLAALRSVHGRDTLGGAPLAKVTALLDIKAMLEQTCDPSAICKAMRESGAIEDIAACCADSEPTLRRPALLLLTALTSGIDELTDATLAALSQSDFARHVVLLLEADNDTVDLACAACQAILAHPNLELCHALCTNGAIARLQALSQCGEPAVEQSAQASMTAVEATMKLAERAHDAVLCVQRGMRRHALARSRRSASRRLDVARAELCPSQCSSSESSPDSPAPRLDIARAARCLSQCSSPAASRRLDIARAARCLSQTPSSPHAARRKRHWGRIS